MKTLNNLFNRFVRIDTILNRWLVGNSITLLRICTGVVFLGFGLLKFFPGISPIEDLATRTTAVLSFGILSGHAAMNFVAALECIIGVCFLTGRFLRVGVLLMAAQMIGAMSPLVIFPGELFNTPMHAPTLAAQYIIKDIILVAAGMVIASTCTGVSIAAEPTSLRIALIKRLTRVQRSQLKPALSI
jgi:uncharacterized membrane protein YphA (DoxX/SURF4 family)